MRLLFCHIENFGTISNRDYNFGLGLNTFCENNGSGKSTLAVFIKAMFFGLPKTTKGDLDKNERQKYKPWQVGSYGGYLDFEVDGRIYRIERYLGEKEADDRLKIYDQAQGTEAINYDKENLGRTLFGVDEPTYEKSIYYSQRQTASGGLDLLDLLEKENDTGGYTKAVSILDNLIKPFNKKLGTSVIAVIEANISEAAQRIAECKGYENRLSQKINSKQEAVRNLEDTEKELQAVREDIDKAVKQASYQKYLEYKVSYGQALHNKQLAEDALGGNIPTETTLETANGKLNILENLINRQKEIDNNLSLARQQAQQIDSGGTDDLKRLAELKLLFKASPPTNDEIKLAADNYEKSRRLELQLKPFTARGKALAFNGKTKAAAAAGLLLLVAGITVLIAGQTIAGICTAAAGLLTAAAGFSGAALTAKKLQKLDLQQHQNEQALLNKEREDALLEVTNFASKYGIDANSFPHAFVEIGQKVSEYTRLKETTAKQANDIREQLLLLINQQSRIADEITLLKQTLIGFFISYRITEVTDFKDAYKVLHGKFIEYNGLKAVYKASKESFDLCPKPADNEIIYSQTQYDLDALKLQEIELGGRQRQLVASLAALGNEITGLTEQAARKSEYELQYKSLIQQKDDSQNRQNVLTQTLKYIKAAKSSLTEKYLTGMNTAFARYANTVLGSSGEAAFDTNLGYSIVEAGEKRTPESFSRGLRDLFDICAQLALADTIYKDKKPFLVLDDPFKNLDDDKMQTAKKLLGTLAEEQQIIYLVCHSSRKL